MIISLKEFASSGKFGPIGIGTTKSEIIETLGEPDEDYDYGTGSSSLKYSSFEFFYWTDSKSLSAIQNENYKVEYPANFTFKNDYFELDTWFFKYNMKFTFKDVISILEKEQVSFVVQDFLDRKIIVFPSEFILDFDNEEWNQSLGRWQVIKAYENYKLLGFRYFKNE